ncbi:MAG: proton-conducting transporter membrane subunit, partial [Bacteroidota bacterium]
MNALIVIYPVLTQSLLAVLLLFGWRRARWQGWGSLAGSVLHVGVAAWLFMRVWTEGTLVMQAGNWAAPFGISFVADTLSATLVLLTSLVGLAASMYAMATVHPARLAHGFFPVLHFLLMGLCGAFLTGDVFNLYVWFEVIIISSFVLITLGNERKQLAGAVRYFGLNMLASILFLTGLGILYGLFGSLNMADLAGQVAAFENREIVYVCALFFLVSFGIKSAVFPLYFWLPDSYHTPPFAVSAVFGALLTKVGVYAMVRMFTLVFSGDVFLGELLGWMALLTIISGGSGALVQSHLRRTLSYLIICHIGFLLAGLAVLNVEGLAGMTAYLIHDLPVKANVFFIAGLIYLLKQNEQMSQLGGLYRSYPRLSLLMAIPLFALAGIPPLSGFWPKISLVLGTLNATHYALLGGILFGSFLTLVVVARMWAQAFWQDDEADQGETAQRWSSLSAQKKVLLLAPILLL